MKILRNILLTLLLIVVVLAVTKNWLIEWAIEGSSRMAGFPTHVGSFRLSLLKSYIGLRNIEVISPKGFHDEPMLQVPDIFVGLNTPDLFKGKVRFSDLRFEMDQMVVVKNEQGVINFRALEGQRVPKKGEEKKPEAKPQEKPKGKAPEISIDHLRLRIGKVVFKNYTAGSNVPTVKEFNLKIDEEYYNIKNIQAFVSLVMFKALKDTTIAQLAGVDMKAISGLAGDTIAASQEAAAKAVGAAKDLAGEKAGQVAGAATDKAKGLAGSIGGLKDKVKLPFGNNE